jgi:hypothetical protein
MIIIKKCGDERDRERNLWNWILIFVKILGTYDKFDDVLYTELIIAPSKISNNESFKPDILDLKLMVYYLHYWSM